MRHIFIVNKHSNLNKTAKRIEEIKDICSSLAVDYEIYFVDDQSEIANIAGQFRNEECILYAVGGDGTVNHLLNAIMGGKASLGLIPFGSGNSLYQTLKEREELVIDCNVMKINDRYCLNYFSVGVEALVTKRFEQLKKIGLPASYAYKLAVIHTIYKYNPTSTLIKADGRNYYSSDMSFVAICNGKYCGLDKKIAPDADITAPNAVVYLGGKLSMFAIPDFLGNLAKGTLEQKYALEKKNAKNIEIIAKNSLIANIDGEIIEDTHFDIDAAAGKIKVVQPTQILELIRKK